MVAVVCVQKYFPLHYPPECENPPPPPSPPYIHICFCVCMNTLVRTHTRTHNHAITCTQTHTRTHSTWTANGLRRRTHHSRCAISWICRLQHTSTSLHTSSYLLHACLHTPFPRSTRHFYRHLFRHGFLQSVAHILESQCPSTFTIYRHCWEHF